MNILAESTIPIYQTIKSDPVLLVIFITTTGALLVLLIVWVIRQITGIKYSILFKKIFMPFIWIYNLVKSLFQIIFKGLSLLIEYTIKPLVLVVIDILREAQSEIKAKDSTKSIKNKK
jgi:hypothetical protein